MERNTKTAIMYKGIIIHFIIHFIIHILDNNTYITTLLFIVPSGTVGTVESQEASILKGS